MNIETALSSIGDLAAALPHVSGRTAPIALITAERILLMRSSSRSDELPAGVVDFAVSPSNDGARPAGWGIVASPAKRVRHGGPDGQWVLKYTLRPATTEEIPGVVAVMADRWMAEAAKIINLPCDDVSAVGAYDARAAHLQALVDLVAAAVA